MIKEKERPKDWEIGDTFYYKIDNTPDENLNGNYIIFNKAGNRKWGNASLIPIFRIKMTKDRKLPVTKEEIEKLDYLKVGLTIWENRFLPYSDSKTLEERQNTIFYPDKFGNLSEYMISIIITRKNNVPNDWSYLGNFIIKEPDDEYIPFDYVNITTHYWNVAKNQLYNYYTNFYLKKSILYNKDVIMKKRKLEQKINDMAVAYLKEMRKNENVTQVLNNGEEIIQNLGFGVKLYDNDVSLDVKDYYKSIYKKEMTGQEVTEKLIEQFEEYLACEDDSIFFWLALADLEMKDKILDKRVKDKAYKSIELDLKRWNNELYLERKKELDKLKKRLDNYGKN